jgi:hypothetical protein
MNIDRLRNAESAGRITLEPFHYGLEFPIAVLLAATSVQLTINIQNDSDFVLKSTELAVFSAAGVNVPDPDMMISFDDTGSGQNWQDVAQHVWNIMGTAQRPYYWSEPRFIIGGTVINVLLNNREAAAMLADITLSGFKVRYKPGFTRDATFF